jgi:uncharacterized protein Usg
MSFVYEGLQILAPCFDYSTQLPLFVTKDYIIQETYTNKNVEISHSDNDLQAPVHNVYVTQSAIVLLSGNIHLRITVKAT